MLQKKKIIIFDEATSNVDKDTEKIQKKPPNECEKITSQGNNTKVFWTKSV